MAGVRRALAMPMQGLRDQAARLQPSSAHKNWLRAHLPDSQRALLAAKGRAVACARVVRNNPSVSLSVGALLSAGLLQWLPAAAALPLATRLVCVAACSLAAYLATRWRSALPALKDAGTSVLASLALALVLGLPLPLVLPLLVYVALATFAVSFAFRQLTARQRIIVLLSLAALIAVAWAAYTPERLEALEQALAYLRREVPLWRQRARSWVEDRLPALPGPHAPVRIQGVQP